MSTSTQVLTAEQKTAIWSLVSKTLLEVVMTPGGGLWNVSDCDKPTRTFSSFSSFEEYQKFVLDTCEHFVATDGNAFLPESERVKSGGYAIAFIKINELIDMILPNDVFKPRQWKEMPHYFRAGCDSALRRRRRRIDYVLIQVFIIDPLLLIQVKFRLNSDSIHLNSTSSNVLHHLVLHQLCIQYVTLGIQHVVRLACT